MVKHTRQQQTTNCLNVFDHFVGLPLKELKACLGPYQTSMMELFCKNTERLLVFNYFRKKAASQMLGRVLNTPLNTPLTLILHLKTHGKKLAFRGICSFTNGYSYPTFAPCTKK